MPVQGPRKRIAKNARKMRWAKYREDLYDFHGK
jgi:hypothetical protein